ncbi:MULTISPECIES: hypothetical protein [Trichocoleus]|uniref:Uncharacterized protein n=1 Tax=Trichocoleus desertorum GB2-A4 TaxID=2933944 RepID=A0ABV0JFC8_9CYAN|nr:hypothetical protein [Trichocoleus sp. FACHB-46]MBD1862351.1 hypothetical protein [Trichocoleus sp. FACHB-46]
MGIYWGQWEKNLSKTQEQQKRDDTWAWIELAWQELKFPVRCRELPILPGIYFVGGVLAPEHLSLQTPAGKGEYCSIAEKLPSWVTAEQRQTPFRHALYIGSCHSLWTRWGSHPKNKELYPLMQAGVRMSFYFWCLPPPVGVREAENEKENRLAFEKRLNQRLRPLLDLTEK